MEPQMREANAIRLAHLGVPPDALRETHDEGRGFDWDEELSALLPCPLLLTCAELEILLCFALTSPLHYGMAEEGLCDKLHHHLRAAYRQANASILFAPAPSI